MRRITAYKMYNVDSVLNITTSVNVDKRGWVRKKKKQVVDCEQNYRVLMLGLKNKKYYFATFVN